MGTEIHLYVGGLSVDWGKNSGFINHTELFQPEDLKPAVLDPGYTETVMMEGYSKPLREVLPRLELLGYTMAEVKREYAFTEDEYGEELTRSLSFKKICDLAKTIDLYKVTGKWGPESKANSVPKDIIAKIDDHDFHRGEKRPDTWDISLLLHGFSPYAQLRLLAQNPNNWDVPVNYPFGYLVDAGWAKREDFLIDPTLKPSEQFLIVTEGSSDAKILQKALKLLRPAYAEFFRFIDMEEGYPFSGTGNLFRFCQGLVSIGILNQVLILYDNDAEGVSKYEATKKLALPPNMVVAKLPDLRALKKFDTIGPHGSRKVNINGSAASIECYLDLNYKATKPALVRWSLYVEALDRYQGALEHKSAYMKMFLNLKKADSSYDFTKMEAVLDHLYNLCTTMAGTERIRRYG